jgi:hypothetical protein
MFVSIEIKEEFVTVSVTIFIVSKLEDLAASAAGTLQL